MGELTPLLEPLCTRCAYVKVGFTWGLGGKIKAQYTKSYKDLLKAASSKRSGLDMFAFKILFRGIALFLAGAPDDDLRKIRNHCLKHKMIFYRQNRVSLLKDPEPSDLPQPAEVATPSPVSSAAPTTPAAATGLTAPVTPAGSEASTDSWWGSYAPEWLCGMPPPLNPLTLKKTKQLSSSFPNLLMYLRNLRTQIWRLALLNLMRRRRKRRKRQRKRGVLFVVSVAAEKKKKKKKKKS